MKLVLLGYMGSGKTSVGKHLSNTLGFDLLDLDEEIARIERMSIQQLFSEKGEIYFRKKESETLMKILNSNDKLVLCTGGGTPCYGTNMKDLQDEQEVITIYLKTSLNVLAERLSKENTNRPLIDHLNSTEKLKEFIGKHLFERTHFYNQSQVIIDTKDHSISEITEKIIARLF